MVRRRRLKGVMVGAGYFAGFQAEGWRRIPAVHIAAVADPLPGRAAEFAARWGIPHSYIHAGEMLDAEKPEFADIATRPDSHVELTRLAAGHGAAVISQKPMAPTWEDCTAMVDHCAQSGVRLLIHENWRWQPWYREIKALIDAGRFGDLFHLGFHMRSGDGRGPEPYAVQPYFRQMEHLLIYETAVHFLDTFRFLAGEIKSVFCQTSRINRSIRGEDYVLLQLSFANGARGIIDANRISGDLPPKVAFGELRLEGDRAMVRMEPDGGLFLTDYGKREAVHPGSFSREGYKGDSVKAAQEHFASCLLTGMRAESEGADYLKTVRAVFASYQSAETGAPVKVDA